MMQTVKGILSSKGSAVRSVTPEDTVLHALGVMAEHDIGGVLVLDGEKLVGILTERDYARRVVLLGRASRDLPVAEIMTSHVCCVSPDRTLEECMALMTEKRTRHLPVLYHKKVIGVISIGDVVKETIAEQEFEIAQLNSYISG
jgi:CBS domain-containing protein